MEGLLEFFKSLGVLGWVLVALCVLVLLNLKKIIWLRSPLDSQKHREWRDDIGGMSGSTTKADHLENEDKER